jgi:hypothetical protein
MEVRGAKAKREKICQVVYRSFFEADDATLSHFLLPDVPDSNRTVTIR